MSVVRRSFCERCRQEIALLGSSDKFIAHRCGHGLPCFQAQDGRPSCSACALEIGAPRQFEAADRPVAPLQLPDPPTDLATLERIDASLELDRQSLERMRTDVRSALQDVSIGQRAVGMLRRALEAKGP